VDIRRVAREAAVSTATVSRVMSGRGPVSADTRERVLEVVQRLQYSPSASARSLRTSRTMLMAVLVPDLANPVFVPFLRGVQHVAQSRGYSVLVVDAQRSLEVERRALDRLLELRVDALVIAGEAREPARMQQLRRFGMVVVDTLAEVGETRSLTPELEAPGTAAMCDALAGLGHTRIGYVSGERGLGEAGRRRWAALQARCGELGMRLEHVTVQRGASQDDTSVVLRTLVRSASPLTALVSASLRLAPELLRALNLAGIVLPDDCSFATYGDSDWAAAHQPAISVVTMDLYEVAGLMTRQIVERLDGGPSVVRPLPGAARFVARESVGPPPSLPRRPQAQRAGSSAQSAQMPR
jgi:LacI family transcriptional regulator